MSEIKKLSDMRNTPTSSNILNHRLKNDPEFKQKIFQQRESFSNKMADGEYRSQFGSEFESGSGGGLPGIIVRFFGKGHLKNIATSNYNKGFAESTNVDLYEHEKNGEKLKAKQEKAVDSLFWISVKVFTAIFAVAGALIGGFIIGEALGGGTAAVLGGIGIGLGGGLLVGGVLGAIDGWVEKQQTNNYINKSHYEGKSDGKHAENHAVRDYNQVVMEQNRVVDKQKIQNLEKRVEILESRGKNYSMIESTAKPEISNPNVFGHHYKENPVSQIVSQNQDKSNDNISQILSQNKPASGNLSYADRTAKSLSDTPEKGEGMSIQ